MVYAVFLFKLMFSYIYEHNRELRYFIKMLTFRIFGIFIIFNLYIASSKEDCSCCEPPKLICDPDPTRWGAVPGIYETTTGFDQNGCMMLTFNCSSDTDPSAFALMYDDDQVSFSKISSSKNIFRITIWVLEMF